MTPGCAESTLTVRNIKLSILCKFPQRGVRQFILLLELTCLLYEMI